jgi:hypothetical protein
MQLWPGCDHDHVRQCPESWQGGQATLSARPVVPAGPEQLAAHYDLTMSRPAPDHPAFAAFDCWLAAAADAHGLTCALLHDGVIDEVLRRLDDGRLTLGLHLDYFALWHKPDDRYARLAQAVEDAGGSPINSPERSRLFTDKAAAHARLTRRGLGVPETVVLRRWNAGRPLTKAERSRLRLDAPGAQVYVKPANGFGGKGVVRTGPENLATAIAAARGHDPNDSLLIQREVRCPLLECDDGVERPAYWRVLRLLDELIPFWWSAHGSCYRLLTREEIRRHRLRPVLSYAAVLARVSEMAWFSTELCLSDGPEPSRYTVRDDDGRERPVLAIDYVNDQCDVDVQSRCPTGLPDAVVRHIAWRFAEAAWLDRHTVAPMPRASHLGPAA